MKIQQFKIGGRVVNVRQAQGISGHLILSEDGRYSFRVQDGLDEAGQAILDFEVCHTNLWVQILDPHAGLYETEDGEIRILDSSPYESSYSS